MNAFVKLLPCHPEFDRCVEAEWWPANSGCRRVAAPIEIATTVARHRRNVAFPSAPSEVLVTRWRGQDAPIAVGPTRDDHYAIMAIAVSTTDAMIWIDDVIVHDGRLSAGTFQLVAPGHSVKSTFRKSADFLRLYIPRAVFIGLTAGTAFAQTEPRLSARPSHDHVVEQLAHSILNTSYGDQPIDRRFLDGVSTALLARAGVVLSKKHDGRSNWEGLVPWRLNKVIDFIDANLDAPLLLADMARAAGLSRMHFAAQFRLATGFRPHAYLIRRRIERAQDLLRYTPMPLVEIALSVGFQTQAHFTTIFRELSGEPPGQWRHREAAMSDAVAVAI